MTLQNRLIKDARSGAKALPVRRKHIRKLAVHAKNSWGMSGLSVEQIAANIQEGKVSLLGVPLIVDRD